MSGAIEQTSSGLGTTQSEDLDGRAALDRARDYLLSLQDPRRLVEGRAGDERDHGRRGPPAARSSSASASADASSAPRAWIRSQQRDDGSWANFYGGARRPLDDDRVLRRAPARRRRTGRAPHARRAANSSAHAGGIADTRACSRASGSRCSASGSWDDVPALPPELMLPAAVGPAEHLRLRVLGAPDDRRAHDRAADCARSAPCPFALDELADRAPVVAAGRATCSGAASSCARPRAAHLRAAPADAAAAPARWREAERWIVDRQEADGSWGGIQPPWVYSLMALSPARLRASAHPVMRTRARRARAVH